MDGSDVLSHHGAERGERGDEPECARVQLEADDESHQYHRLVEGDGGVKNLILLLQGEPQHAIDARTRLSGIRSPNASTVLLSIARS